MSDFKKRMTEVLSGKPVWYIDTLQAVTTALQTIVTARFKVYVDPCADGAAVFIRMDENLSHQILRLALGSDDVVLTGFHGLVRTIQTDDVPDKNELEEAILAIIDDGKAVIDVCRMVSSGAN